MTTKNKMKGEWAEKLKGYPCYKPSWAYPGVCLNENMSVKRLDCGGCPIARLKEGK